MCSLVNIMQLNALVIITCNVKFMHMSGCYDVPKPEEEDVEDREVERQAQRKLSNHQPR